MPKLYKCITYSSTFSDQENNKSTFAKSALAALWLPAIVQTFYTFCKTPWVEQWGARRAWRLWNDQTRCLQPPCPQQQIQGIDSPTPAICHLQQVITTCISLQRIHSSSIIQLSKARTWTRHWVTKSGIRLAACSTAFWLQVRQLSTLIPWAVWA